MRKVIVLLLMLLRLSLIFSVEEKEVIKMNKYKNEYFSFNYPPKVDVINFSMEEVFIKSKVNKNNFFSIKYYKLTKQNKMKYDEIWNDKLKFIEDDEQMEMVEQGIAVIDYTKIDNIKAVMATVNFPDLKIIIINTFKNELEIEINIQIDKNRSNNFEHIYTEIIRSLKLNKCNYNDKQKKSKLILSKEEALEDFQELLEKLKTHPNLFYDRSKDQTNIDINKTIEKIKKKETWYAKKLFLLFSNFVSRINDGHTSYYFENDRLIKEEKLIPIDVTIRNKKIYLKNEIESFSEKIIGREIISINNKKSSEIIDEISNHVSSDNGNTQWKEYRIQEEFRYLYNLKYNKSEKFIIKIKTNNKKIETIDITNNRYFKKNKINKSFNFNFNENNRYCYLEISNFIDSGDFREKALFLINRIKMKKYNNLIVDVRNNNGGDSELSDYIIKEFKENLNEEIKYNIYLLIGRSTFSSAVSFSALLKYNLENVTLIGEETGGYLDSFGNAYSTQLTNSGLNYQISTNRFEFHKLIGKEDEIKILKPDIKINIDVKKEVNGIDEVMEKVIEIIKNKNGEK